MDGCLLVTVRLEQRLWYTEGLLNSVYVKRMAEELGV